MTHPELLQLRREARRSEKIRPSAALLFAEICDFHELPEGCKVSNEGFAERLDCTVRSIRNWINELVSCGLVIETHEGGNRYLEPRIPSWINLSDEEQGRKRGSAAENSFRDGNDIRKNDSEGRKPHSEGGGKFVPTQRDNKPAEARERAHAHEEGAKGQGRTALSIHQRWFPDVSLSIGQKEILKQIDDLDTWADVVEWWCGNRYKGRSISRMKQKHQERLEEERESILSPERQEDPRWSVDEQGRKCYDGVPIEEFNCPNLAADLQEDHAGDGTAGREPEVSTHG